MCADAQCACAALYLFRATPGAPACCFPACAPHSIRQCSSPHSFADGGVPHSFSVAGVLNCYSVDDVPRALSVDGVLNRFSVGGVPPLTLACPASSRIAASAAGASLAAWRSTCSAATPGTLAGTLHSLHTTLCCLIPSSAPHACVIFPLQARRRPAWFNLFRSHPWDPSGRHAQP
ncbi:hypothetical protein COO60DRAFT_975533 [Scenedesmus sp. NREL 46B-D3]|nr:hypothetical protein COO60DRAFT_975533 [Scenedesmus sp. NREL 46B-D3]